MRKLWTYLAAGTAALSLGAVFFGVSAPAAAESRETLTTSLAAAERPAATPTEQREELEPVTYTKSATPKRLTSAPTPSAPAPKTTSGKRASSGGTAARSVSESARARAILAGYIARYPILRGTTVSFGNAQGHQAISYYKEGRIVISRSHTASLERILAHEIWHVIDWRDNHRIDWGENVPPR